jgi:predicted ATP-dependent Lon-type protease
MTREELASKLDHLDPGATLKVTESVLAALFGEGRLSKEAVAMIEEFALEHRCTFSVEPGRGTPTFEKDDIF